jgi:Rrf2 family protein
MWLSRKSDYAIRAVRHCARLDKGERASINAIAEAEKIPRDFLAKVLGDLARAEILVSFAGNKGGYALARSPRQVSFLNVVEAVDGPIYLNLCTMPGECRCEAAEGCDLCEFWKALEKSFKSKLDAQHFGKLVQNCGKK